MSLRDYRVLWVGVLLGFLCFLRADRTNRDLLYLQNQIMLRSLKPPTERELFERTAVGMISSLDDPHSAYIPDSLTQQFNEMIDSTMRGIGIEMRIDPASDQPIVISPVDGSPAQHAGLRAGDRIVRVDDHDTKGCPLKEVQSWIRGEARTTVRLRIVATTTPATENDTAAERVVSVMRDSFPVPAVAGDAREADGRWDFRLRGDPSIGYIRILSFGQQTAFELERAIHTLTSPTSGADGSVVRGLILDLRGNPGGLLHQGILICDQFLDDGVIVTQRGRDGVIVDIAMAASDDTIPEARELPIVILVDRDTASAAEVVAACLADHGRAVIVGERSYGKGSIQDLVTLPKGRGMFKLTTGSYWRPSGRNINRFPDSTDADDWGVSPEPENRFTATPETEARRVIWRELFDAPDPQMIPVSQIAANLVEPDVTPPGKTHDHAESTEPAPDASAGETPDAAATEPESAMDESERQMRKAAEEAKKLPITWWLDVDRMTLDPALQRAVRILTAP